MFQANQSQIFHIEIAARAPALNIFLNDTGITGIQLVQIDLMLGYDIACVFNHYSTHMYQLSS